MRFKFSLFITALVLSQSLYSQSLAPAKFEHFQANTRYAPLSIQAEAPKDSLDKYLKGLLPWIERFSQSYSYSGPLDSIIYNSPIGTELKLDTLSTQLLKFGESTYHQTNQNIDVGIGNLLRAWKIGWQQESQLPTPETLQQLTHQLQTFPYKITPQNKVKILDSNRHIAMGAYLEGRILNEITQRLHQAGAKNYLIDLGGDFAFSGQKTPNKPWRLGIKNPLDPKEILVSVAIPSKFKGLSTSGSYEQTFKDSTGQVHHHIFDPKTGSSSKGHLSVTVLSQDPMDNDLFDTWYMLLPLEEIKAHIKNSKGKVEAIVIQDDHHIWISPGLKDHTQTLVLPLGWTSN